MVRQQQGNNKATARQWQGKTRQWQWLQQQEEGVQIQTINKHINAVASTTAIATL